MIGPNANDKDVLLGNYNGQPSVSYTALDGIKNKVSPQTKVLYSEGMFPTGVIFQPIEESALSNGAKPGLKAEYFNNNGFKGEPTLVRTDAKIDFNWAAQSPAKEISEDNFSVRWTGKLTATQSGTYTLGWRSNGSVRIFVDGSLYLEETTNKRTRNVLKNFDFTAGRSYDIRIEYQENANHFASAKLECMREPAIHTQKNEKIFLRNIPNREN